MNAHSAILPAELWKKLDDSLANTDLRLSSERARLRALQLALLLKQDDEAGENEQLFVSLAAMGLAGALGCRLRREAQRRLMPSPSMHPDPHGEPDRNAVAKPCE